MSIEPNTTNVTPTVPAPNASVGLGKTFFNAVGRFGKNTVEQLLINPLKDSAIHYMICPTRYLAVKVAQHTPIIKNKENVKNWVASDPEHYVEKKTRMLTTGKEKTFESSFLRGYNEKDRHIAKYVTKSPEELASESAKKLEARNQPHRFLVEHAIHGLDVVIGRPIEYIINDVVLATAGLFATSVGMTFMGVTWPVRAPAALVLKEFKLYKEDKPYNTAYSKALKDFNTNLDEGEKSFKLLKDAVTSSTKPTEAAPNTDEALKENQPQVENENREETLEEVAKAETEALQLVEKQREEKETALNADIRKTNTFFQAMLANINTLSSLVSPRFNDLGIQEAEEKELETAAAMKELITDVEEQLKNDEKTLDLNAAKALYARLKPSANEECSSTEAPSDPCCETPTADVKPEIQKGYDLEETKKCIANIKIAIKDSKAEQKAILKKYSNRQLTAFDRSKEALRLGVEAKEQSNKFTAFLTENHLEMPAQE